MKFNKPAKTLDEQLDILLERGLIIDDRARAIHYLSHLNYYRLEAYWVPFEISRNPHQFAQGTTFEQILNHYLFDRELRLHLLDAIERIEVSFKTQWAYYISCQYGPHGYLNDSEGMRKDSRRLKSDIAELRDHVGRSDDIFITHYRKTYDEELPPAWVSCEVMSLGLLSRFYSNLRAYAVRQSIAAVYQFDEGFLEGFMEHLSYVRNVCAHHSRLWNRHLSKKMPLPKGKPKGIKENINANAEHAIYNTLVVIHHLIQVISPTSNWTKQLLGLMDKYHINKSKMGFPANWEMLPIWKPH